MYIKGPKKSFLEVVSEHRSSLSEHAIEYQSFCKSCPDTWLASPNMPLCYFIFTHVLSAYPDNGMSHPDRLRRKTIFILIRSFIRFRSLVAIKYAYSL